MLLRTMFRGFLAMKGLPENRAVSYLSSDYRKRELYAQNVNY
jgi:hypothetical protein